MGILDSTAYSFDISGHKYRKLHYIVGFDTEKTLHAGYTGLDMKNGQLMTIKIKAKDATEMNAMSRMPTTINIVLHSDQILEISDTGSQVLD